MPQTRLSLGPAIVAVVVSLAWLGLVPVALADFPPITEAEQALTKVPGEPGAPAVVLFNKVAYRMQDPSATYDESRTTILRRVKILTEAGLDHAEISLFHSDSHRLLKLEGRTVLPDGRVVTLDTDAKFQRRVSRLNDLYVTVAAFPAVEVGAILDVRFELRSDTTFNIRPWLFQERIPTLFSEVVYDVNERFSFNVWARESAPGSLKIKDEKSVYGHRVTAWVENAFPIPAEPFGFPITDLATRIAVLPVSVRGTWPLLEDWSTACAWMKRSYDAALSQTRKTKARALEVAGETGRDPRSLAMALYRLVRDEIVTEKIWSGIWIGSESTVDDILEAKKGSASSKALLLYALLDAAKLEPELVWAADREDGRPDVETPNFAWFDRVLVRVELGREAVFLDPSDRRLGFGQLDPGYDGGKALLYSPKKPKVVTLPAIPAQPARDAPSSSSSSMPRAACAAKARSGFASMPPSRRWKIKMTPTSPRTIGRAGSRSASATSRPAVWRSSARSTSGSSSCASSSSNTRKTSWETKRAYSPLARSRSSSPSPCHPNGARPRSCYPSSGLKRSSSTCAGARAGSSPRAHRRWPRAARPVPTRRPTRSTPRGASCARPGVSRSLSESTRGPRPTGRCAIFISLRRRTMQRPWLWCVASLLFVYAAGTSTSA
ncbi:MAG: DUF3857 domain-containing protein, partial [Thermoanaerobaculia bacterium]|nr:DUF3857 domain-containing protein [Thermoanaerobaculia bacterium]